MTPRSAQPGEYAAAFRLLFRHLDPADLDDRVRRTLDLIAGGGLDVGGLFVLPGPAGPRGAMLCQTVPGAGGLVWPPAVADYDRSGETSLIVAALGWLRGAGARLAQCLLPDEEFALAAPLVRNGFDHPTGLTFLRHDLTPTAAWLAGNDRLELACYDEENPSAFHAALMASYDGTLDCPEINGVRTIGDVIAGHRAQGRYDPSTWWLARLDGEPAGVLILVEAEPGQWEIAYAGVVPPARRRGVAVGLMYHALCHLRGVEADGLMVTVDDRNTPARRLYHRLGFEPYDHREVVMVLL